MPRIHLKPNSPEFDEHQKAQAQVKPCEMPGCPHEGTFSCGPKTAPYPIITGSVKCILSNITRHGNFFDGMNAKEVEDHILKSMFGDRPTWRYDMPGMAEDNLRQRAWEFYGRGENPDDRAGRAWEEYQKRGNEFDNNSKEWDAMAIFGLEPPLDFRSHKTTL